MLETICIQRFYLTNTLRRAAMVLVLIFFWTSPLAAQGAGDAILKANFEDCAPTYAPGMVSAWNDNFTQWPGFGVRQRRWVPYGGYLSYEFTATLLPGQFGTVATTDFAGDGDGIGLMSISSTPGCFDPDHLQPTCLSALSRFVSIGWRNSIGVFSCALTPGQTYYVNITYGSNDPNGPHCPEGPPGCGADIQNQIQ